MGIKQKNDFLCGSWNQEVFHHFLHKRQLKRSFGHKKGIKAFVMIYEEIVEE